MEASLKKELGLGDSWHAGTYTLVAELLGDKSPNKGHQGVHVGHLS